MSDLISRQAALEALSHMMDTDGFRDGWAVSRANVDCMLRSLPSVEPERKTGKWIPFRVIDECGDLLFIEYRCSICERRIKCMSGSLSHYPYCHCGADMREVQNK